MVSPANRNEVYRTVVMRGEHVDKTWAPWWRAQAQAIAEVALQEEPNKKAHDRYLNKELKFADSLEKKKRNA